VFGSVPIFNDLAPDAPGIDITSTSPTWTVNLPAPPSLLSISVSPFGGVNIPTLDVTIPELTIDAPSIREYVPGRAVHIWTADAAQGEARGHPDQRRHRPVARRRERDLGSRPRA
jgi:hypothetical protein